LSPRRAAAARAALQVKRSAASILADSSKSAFFCSGLRSDFTFFTLSFYTLLSLQVNEYLKEIFGFPFRQRLNPAVSDRF
jgi:hypothetical protein